VARREEKKRRGKKRREGVRGVELKRVVERRKENGKR
jgi:hypothetical protein